MGKQLLGHGTGGDVRKQARVGAVQLTGNEGKVAPMPLDLLIYLRMGTWLFIPPVASNQSVPSRAMPNGSRPRAVAHCTGEERGALDVSQLWAKRRTRKKMFRSCWIKTGIHPRSRCSLPGSML